MLTFIKNLFNSITNDCSTSTDTAKPIVTKPKRVLDTRPVKKQHYAYINSVRKMYERSKLTDNPMDLHQVTALINEQLGLNKSVSVYGRIFKKLRIQENNSNSIDD